MTNTADILLNFLIDIYHKTGKDIFTNDQYCHISGYAEAIKELIDLGILRKYVSGNITFESVFKKNNLWAIKSRYYFEMFRLF